MPIIDQKPDDYSHRSRRRLKRGCCGCGCGCGVPALLFVVFSLLVLVRNRPPNITIPARPMPANNAYEDFTRAAEMVAAIKHKSPVSMDRPPATRESYLAQARACEKESAAALALLRSAFSRPYACPPSRTIAQVLNSGRQSSYREVARTLAGIAMGHEIAGEAGIAASLLLDCLEFGVTVPHGGETVEELLGFSCEAIALSRFERLLPLMTSDELGDTARRLAAIAGKRAPFDELIEENGYFDAALQQEQYRSPRFSTLTGQWEGLRENVDAASGVRLKLESVWEAAGTAVMDKSADIRNTLRCNQIVVSEARKPFPSKLKVNPADALLMAMMDTSENLRARHIARASVLEIVRLEIALYRYRAAHGRFPATLKELAPAYLPSVPKDPLGSAAKPDYHYTVSSDRSRFILYGIGPDGTDHGGRIGRAGRDYGQPGFDIVAGSISKQGKLFP